jgi:hypothetical protein
MCHVSESSFLLTQSVLIYRHCGVHGGDVSHISKKCVKCFTMLRVCWCGTTLVLSQTLMFCYFLNGGEDSDNAQCREDMCKYVKGCSIWSCSSSLSEFRYIGRRYRSCGSWCSLVSNYTRRCVNFFDDHVAMCQNLNFLPLRTLIPYAHGLADDRVGVEEVMIGEVTMDGGRV